MTLYTKASFSLRPRLLTVIDGHSENAASHCICCKRACIICRQQIDQVEFEPQHEGTVCANNRQVTVCVTMCIKYRLQRSLPGGYTRRPARYGRFWVRQRRAIHRRITQVSALDSENCVF